MNVTKNSPVLLFVHGGGHGDPAYFVPFETELQKAGFETATGQSPAERGKEVVLFMHSVGVVVGTEAAQGVTRAEREKAGLPGGVVHLIGLAGYLADEGQAVITFYEEDWGLPRVIEFTEENGTPIGRFMPFAKYFYSDFPQEQVAMWAQYGKSLPSEWVAQPVTHTTWKDVPTSWIFTEIDEVLPVEFQKKVIQKAEEKHGVKLQTFSLHSGHSPMLNMPDKLTEVVKKIYQSIRA